MSKRLEKQGGICEPTAHGGVNKGCDLAVIWLQWLCGAAGRGVRPGWHLERDGAWTGPGAVPLP